MVVSFGNDDYIEMSEPLNQKLPSECNAEQ